MDEFALSNPYFDKALAQAECQQQIVTLKAQKKQEEYERRKQAKIAVLDQGLKLEDFDFYDARVIEKYAPI